jgi:hypothetical protein
MGIREKLNKYPILGYSVIPIAAVAIVMAIRSSRSYLPSGINASYFSADDGKTFFSDDVKKIPPFDYHGSQAVRAHVFRGADGKLFVGYLEKIDPEAAAAIRKVQDRKPGDPPLDPSLLGIVMAGHEYKRPGDTKWVNGMDRINVGKIKTIVGANGVPLDEVDDN